VSKILEVIVPVLLTFLLAGVVDLYSRIGELEKTTMHTEVLELRLDRLEKGNCE